jgi:hypothetical protein
MNLSLFLFIFRKAFLLMKLIEEGILRYII